MTMKKWWKDVRRDFVRKEFIPLKILFFFMFGGMMALFPFLTIQARSLGITGEELGIIYGVIPVIGIFGPSLAGLLADKVGNFKIILSATVLGSGCASLLFLLIPVGRIYHTLPMHLPITVNCTIDGAEITVDPPFSCDVNTESNINHTVEIQKCIFSCTYDVQQYQMVDEFSNHWCQRTESCEVTDGVELENDFDSINKSSKLSYDVFGLDTEQEIIREFSLNNKTLPLKIYEKSKHLGINRIFCPNFKQLLESGNQSLPNVFGVDIPQMECWMSCEAVTETNSICSNTKTTEEINPSLTFFEYLVIRVINGLLITVSLTLFQGAVVAIIKQNKGDLGLQRVFANLGIIVMTPISGYLIDRFSKTNGTEDYRPAFALYFGIRCLCAFSILFINLEFKQPSNSVLKDFRDLITQARVITFLSFFIVIGACTGLLETFLFWVLEDLGADKSLMAATVTIGAVCGIPLLMTSSLIIKKLGHINTLVFCSFIYVIRITGYSFIKNPWLAMPFEALETFTSALMSVSAMCYVGVLSKPTTVASLQGIFSAAYFGIGRGFGCMMSGFLMKNVGTSATFQMFAVACAIGGTIYFLINKFVFKSNSTHKGKEVHNISKEKEACSEALTAEIQNSNNCFEKGPENSPKIVNELNCTENDKYSDYSPSTTKR